MNVTSESRANEVITKYNRNVEDKDRLPYDEPEAALSLVSNVAADVWDDDDPERRRVGDSAYEVALYLGGASIRKIALASDTHHITRPEDYKKSTLTQSMQRVARAAADIEGDSDDTVMLAGKGKASLDVLLGATDNSPVDIDDTIRSLEISDGLKASLLVLLGQLKPPNAKPDQIKRIKSGIRTVVARRIGYRRREYPLLWQLTEDNSRNGVGEQTLPMIVQRRIDSSSLYGSTEDRLKQIERVKQTVHMQCAQELVRLYDPPRRNTE